MSEKKVVLDIKDLDFVFHLNENVFIQQKEDLGSKIQSAEEKRNSRSNLKMVEKQQNIR